VRIAQASRDELALVGATLAGHGSSPRVNPRVAGPQHEPVAALADPATMRAVLGAAGTLLDGTTAACPPFAGTGPSCTTRSNMRWNGGYLPATQSRSSNGKRRKPRTRLTGAGSSTTPKPGGYSAR
jgi:hypothetical protein